MSLNADKLVNRSLNPKRIDNFYVKFFLPENISNLLGRQLKSITRPNVRIDTSNTFNRGNRYWDKGNIQLDPITAIFSDDESGLTSMILYTHIFRQQNIIADIYGREGVIDRNYKFDLKVETYDSRDRVTESYTLKECLMTELEHSQPIVSGEEDNEITVMMVYDSIDFHIIDQYEQLKGDLNF